MNFPGKLPSKADTLRKFKQRFISLAENFHILSFSMDDLYIYLIIITALFSFYSKNFTNTT